VLVGVVLLASGCAGPAPETRPAPPRSAAVVVASFDFDESRLLAEIYAQALEAAGVSVRRQLALGPRELVLPALQQGLVDLVPEYLGSAVAATAGSPGDLTDGPALRRRLVDALASSGVEALASAPAENSNVFVVADHFAARHRLDAVSDLGGLDPLVFAGPPECPQRRHCLLGLRQRYGLQIAGFVPLDGAGQVRRAIEEGVAEVGVLFSTDGLLARPGLTVLDDDARLNPPEHVVPLLRRDALRRHGEVVRAVVDEVSAQLTSSALRFVNWRVSVAGNEVADEARGWLVRRGIVSR
jgi:osmoprotectant transport system substrate-binding protein